MKLAWFRVLGSGVGKPCSLSRGSGTFLEPLDRWKWWMHGKRKTFVRPKQRRNDHRHRKPRPPKRMK